MYCIILFKTYIFEKKENMKTTLNIKRTILALLLIAAGSTVTFAQCDKTATLTSSVTNYLNDKGEIERTKDEETIITITKTDITIAPGEGNTVTGIIKTNVCNWSTPFKEGKTVLTTTLTDGGRDMHATITIEGKAGKVLLTFEAEEMPGKKIQVVADKFE
jgi:hypothetical protein